MTCTGRCGSSRYGKTVFAGLVPSQATRPPRLPGDDALDSSRPASRPHSYTRGVRIRLWRAIPRSESDVTFRHTAIAANCSYGSDTVGAVHEVTSEGLRAVSSGTVWYSVDGGRVSDGGRVNIVNIDTRGRYTISALRPDLESDSRPLLAACSRRVPSTQSSRQAIPFRTSSWCGRARTMRHVMVRRCRA